MAAYRFSDDRDRIERFYKHRGRFRGLRDDKGYERQAEAFISGSVFSGGVPVIGEPMCANNTSANHQWSAPKPPMV